MPDEDLRQQDEAAFDQWYESLTLPERLEGWNDYPPPPSRRYREASSERGERMRRFWRLDYRAWYDGLKGGEYGSGDSPPKPSH